MKPHRSSAFSVALHRALPGAGLLCAVLSCTMLSCAIAVALSGCGVTDAGSFLIDPGRYSVYHCDELATRWTALVAREKELHGLIDKAGEGGSGGAVIGSLAYRTDYDSVLSEERLLQRTAAEKNCGFKPELQSDQTIR